MTIPLDTHDIGAYAALICSEPGGIILRPGTITGITRTRRTPGYGADPLETIAALWTPIDGDERVLPTNALLAFARDIPEELRAILWPRPPTPAEFVADVIP